MRRAMKDACFVTAKKLGSRYQPERVSELLHQSPPTPRRGFNGFCTSQEQMAFSGVKARRPAEAGSVRIKSTFCQRPVLNRRLAPRDYN